MTFVQLQVTGNSATNWDDSSVVGSVGSGQILALVQWLELFWVEPFLLL